MRSYHIKGNNLLIGKNCKQVKTIKGGSIRNVELGKGTTMVDDEKSNLSNLKNMLQTMSLQPSKRTNKKKRYISF